MVLGWDLQGARGSFWPLELLGAACSRSQVLEMCSLQEPGKGSTPDPRREIPFSFKSPQHPLQTKLNLAQLCKEKYLKGSIQRE